MDRRDGEPERLRALVAAAVKGVTLAMGGAGGRGRPRVFRTSRTRAASAQASGRRDLLSISGYELVVGERTSYAPGTFSWADLATSDLDASKGFYSALLGWEYEEMRAGDAGVYAMAQLEGQDVAALYATAEQPPRWNSYVTVRSADEAARLAGELGARVIAPPFDVMDAGRMAVVQDTTGAVVAVWEARRHPGATLVNAPGALTWNDLITPDAEEAARFYARWLGWRTEEKANGYRVILNGERTNGGIQPLGPEAMGPDAPPQWVPYFGTDRLERALGRARDLGGRVLLGPMPVPGGAEAVIADPQGATCALWSGDYDD